MLKNGKFSSVLRSLPLLTVGLCCFSAFAEAATLQVGPGRPYSAPCAAIAAAANGDTIEIDAGLYLGDVCAWNKDDLTIRGVNGRAHIDANGRNSQGKGIWVASGRNLVVENVEFSGAAVSGHNGAGIRAQGTNWTVRNCYFHDNEDGILESNVSGSNILIEFTEFARNGYSNGQSHNLYIGNTGPLGTLVFRFNYSHDSVVGHLLKTRAGANYILYNRITGENGTGSYEIDVPNGGTTYVIGNLVQQGPSTENSTILTYLEEGTNARNPGTDLYVVNNTFVNQRTAGGNFVRVDSRALPPVIANNIFAGPGTLTNRSDAQLLTNLAVSDPAQAMFVDFNNFNYHLTNTSPAINAGTQPGMGNGYPLEPLYQYVHSASGETRVQEGIIDIGAYEFHDTAPPIISGMPAAGCTLWPPNHKFVQVGTVTASDVPSGLVPGSFQVTGTSNEPSDPKNPDIIISPTAFGGFAVQLRAERLGTGTDRIYTVTATAIDWIGNTATAVATCTVPHDQGH